MPTDRARKQRGRDLTADEKSRIEAIQPARERQA